MLRDYGTFAAGLGILAVIGSMSGRVDPIEPIARLPSEFYNLAAVPALGAAIRKTGEVVYSKMKKRS